MKTKLIKENLDFLESLESYFKTVTYSSYCRNLNKQDVEKLLAFWELYTGSKRQSFNSSCSRCIYSLVSDVAKIYFEYKQSDGKKKQVRQSEILDYLKNGLSKPQICSLIKEKYGVGQSTIDKDFIACRDLILASNQESAASLKVILNYRLEKLYSLALQGNKIETALKVIDQVGKLNNLYIDKQEVKLEDNQFEIVIQ